MLQEGQIVDWFVSSQTRETTRDRHRPVGKITPHRQSCRGPHRYHRTRCRRPRYVTCSTIPSRPGDRRIRYPRKSRSPPHSRRCRRRCRKCRYRSLLFIPTGGGGGGEMVVVVAWFEASEGGCSCNPLPAKARQLGKGNVPQYAVDTE